MAIVGHYQSHRSKSIGESRLNLRMLKQAGNQSVGSDRGNPLKYATVLERK